MREYKSRLEELLSNRWYKIAGVVTGLLIGICAGQVLKRLPKNKITFSKK